MKLKIVFIILISGFYLSAEQPEINARRYKVSPFNEGWFSLFDASPGEIGVLNAGLMFYYGKKPVIINYPSGDVAVIDNHINADFSLAWGINRWFDMAVSFPVVLFQDGKGVSSEKTLPFMGPGDISVIPRYRLFSVFGSLFSASFLPVFSLPTGSQMDSAMGSSSFVFSPTMAFSMESDKVSAALNFYYRITAMQTSREARMGSEVGFSTGFSVHVIKEKLDIFTEFLLSSMTYASFPDEGSSAEIIGGANWLLPFELKISCGGSGGIISGFGTPDFRAFCGVSRKFDVGKKVSAPKEVPKIDTENKATEKDVGSEKKEDPTVEKSEDMEKLHESEDTQKPEDIKKELETAEDTEKTDDVQKKEVSAPAEKKSSSEKKRKQKSSVEKPHTITDPGRRRAPTESGKRIGETILFVLNSANIRNRYELSVEKVAVVLSSNYMLNIKIVGHRGEKEKKGMGLQRARAVKRYLMKEGIEENRIKVISRGAARPANTGDTEKDRRENRRVEFYIVN